MDELLHDRVAQLKTIDERLERILSAEPIILGRGDLRPALLALRDELARMIAEAEAAHAAF